MTQSSRVIVLLLPKRGNPTRVHMGHSDYKAIDAWFRDPTCADVPMHITDADDVAHTFLPGDLVEVAYVGPSSESR